MESDGSVGVIIAAAGRGVRFGAPVPKQLLALAGKSLLTRSVEAFLGVEAVREIVVVVPADLATRPNASCRRRAACPFVSWPAGARRQDSVAAGFRALSPEVDLVLVHDAARAFVTREVIERTIAAASRHGAAVAALAASDTVKRARPGEVALVAETLPRETIYLAQTPQGFTRRGARGCGGPRRAGGGATDEARLAELAGYDVCLVEGDPRNIKVTTERDRDLALALVGDGGRAQEDSGMSAFRIGFGYDSHRLVGGASARARRRRASRSTGASPATRTPMRSPTPSPTPCSAPRPSATSASCSLTPIRDGRTPTASRCWQTPRRARGRPGSGSGTSM